VVDFGGPGTADSAPDPKPPVLVTEQTALAANEAYYRLVETQNEMWADPTGTYDWNAVAVSPLAETLATEQIERIDSGVVMRWPAPSVYKDVITGTRKADPVQVGDRSRDAVPLHTCVIDEVYFTLPADGTEANAGPTTYWIDVTMANDAGTWKMHGAVQRNRADGVHPCGLD